MYICTVELCQWELCLKVLYKYFDWLTICFVFILTLSKTFHKSREKCNSSRWHGYNIVGVGWDKCTAYMYSGFTVFQVLGARTSCLYITTLSIAVCRLWQVASAQPHPLLLGLCFCPSGGPVISVTESSKVMFPCPRIQASEMKYQLIFNEKPISKVSLDKVSVWACSFL